MPTEYGTTPGGTIFGTTPGGKFEQKLINYSNQIQCWSFFKKYIYNNYYNSLNIFFKVHV